MQRVGAFREGTKDSTCVFEFHQLWETVSKTKARTWYQIPLITFLVADPLRNPRVSGRPTAATGFLGTSRRNSGILGNMVKSKSKGVKGRMCRVLVASDTIYIPK